MHSHADDAPPKGAPVAGIAVDGNGCVLALDRAAQELLDLDPSEVVGQPLIGVLAGPWLSAATLSDLERLLRGRSPRLLGRRLELPMSRADGSGFPGELVVTRASAAPVRFDVSIRDLGGRAVTQVESGRRLVLLKRVERAAHIGSWEWAPHANDLTWSDNLFRLLGLEPGEIAASWPWLRERTRPTDRTRLARAIERMRRGGAIRPLAFAVLVPDGPLRHLELTMTATQTHAERSDPVSGTIQDITERHQAEREIAARLAVSEALVTWDSVDSGAPVLLRGLASALDFDVGTLWLARGHALVARAIWHARGEGLTRFARITLQHRLERGEELPGQAWNAGGPISAVLLPGRPLSTREDAAAAASLHGAIALPAVSGGEVLAVIELHSRTQPPLCDRLMRSLIGIGHELGTFLAHRRWELESPALTAREREVLQLAADGMSGPQIAAELVVATSTVKTHFEHIFDKLEASDRASAVAIALRRRLID